MKTAESLTKSNINPKQDVENTHLNPEPISEWSDQDVALWVKAMGPDYEEDSNRLIENAVDGTALLKLQNNENDDDFSEIVSNPAHRKQILTKLKELEEKRRNKNAAAVITSPGPVSKSKNIVASAPIFSTAAESTAQDNNFSITRVFLSNFSSILSGTYSTSTENIPKVIPDRMTPSAIRSLDPKMIRNNYDTNEKNTIYINNKLVTVIANSFEDFKNVDLKYCLLMEQKHQLRLFAKIIYFSFKKVLIEKANHCSRDVLRQAVCAFVGKNLDYKLFRETGWHMAGWDFVQELVSESNPYLNPNRLADFLEDGDFPDFVIQLNKDWNSHLEEVREYLGTLPPPITTPTRGNPPVLLNK